MCAPVRTYSNYTFLREFPSSAIALWRGQSAGKSLLVRMRAEGIVHVWRVEVHSEMAEYLERVLTSVEALLPLDIADYEAEVFAVAAVTTFLAFLGEKLSH